MEKHTGEEPFDVPRGSAPAAPEGRREPLGRPTVGDVPVGFLATGDTTGG